MIIVHFVKSFRVLPVLIGVMGLSACSSSPPSQERAQMGVNMSPQNATNWQSNQNNGGSMVKENTPSAPLETPLCGTALHERAEADTVLYQHSLQSGSSCVVNACFQPLTGTYISENGNNSVCR